MHITFGCVFYDTLNMHIIYSTASLTKHELLYYLQIVLKVLFLIQVLYNSVQNYMRNTSEGKHNNIRVCVFVSIIYVF